MKYSIVLNIPVQNPRLNLALCIGALAVNVIPALADAQGNYPNRAVRIIAPSAPASAADTVARLIAQPLAERLGQPISVEPRPGASTAIGTELVARAAPDGYTLLIGLPALAINPLIYTNLSYDAARDFTPITQAVSQPNLLVVHPSLPATSVKQLIALAKARPGELVYASSGVGTSSHLTIELFLFMTGTRMLNVPYKGPGPGVIDLMAGRMSVMAPSTIATLPHVRSGRLRALGITTAQRVASLPDIPTIAESGVPGYESVSWYGLLAPAGTPKDIVARLARETIAILHTPEIRERFAREGTEVVAEGPEAFGRYISSERVKWAKVVKSAGIKPE